MKRDEAKDLVTEGLKQLNDALAQGRSQTLMRYLEVMARFHNYSFGNCMLILMQRPDSSHVAGFRRWIELGRHVKKGEKGIAILAPMVYRKKAKADDAEDETESRALRGFKVVHVFDVSQTEGRELAQFASIQGDPGDKITRLEDLIAECGIELEYATLGFAVKGESRGGHITIQQGLEPAERFAVLLHELSHELLAHINRHHETTKTVRETEAEAVAYVVSRAVGLDPTTRSSDYIQLYRGDTETLSESFEAIQKTAAYILTELEAEAPTRRYACAG